MKRKTLRIKKTESLSNHGLLRELPATTRRPLQFTLNRWIPLVCLLLYFLPFHQQVQGAQNSQSDNIKRLTDMFTMPPYQGWWIALGMGLLYLVPYFLERNRTKKLGEVSDGLGFRFFPKGDITKTEQLFAGVLPPKEPGNTAVIERLVKEGLVSRFVEISNMLYKSIDGIEMGMFDTAESTGGKRIDKHREGIIYFYSSELHLPEFFMRYTRSSRGKDNNIDFEMNPAFSNAYRLWTGIRGGEGNEEAVRKVFDGELLRFFEGSPKIWRLVGSGRHLLYYPIEDSKRIKPSDVQMHLQHGLKIFKELKDRCPKAADASGQSKEEG